MNKLLFHLGLLIIAFGALFAYRLFLSPVKSGGVRDERIEAALFILESQRDPMEVLGRQEFRNRRQSGYTK